MALSDSLKKQISDLVTTQPVVLFMKGTRRAPQCGFSAQVVQILDELVPEYETVDVLSSAELRDGIKEYTQWPTIPQLFIRGQFVGGCDITRDLHQSGELAQLLGAAQEAVPVPTVHVSPTALKALGDALGDVTTDAVHLRIDQRFQYDLFVGPRESGEIEANAEGITLLLDRASARRAEGLNIDYIEGDNAGFKITNPNEPASVKQLSAPALKQLLDSGAVLLFDVRPQHERERASIAGARPLDAPGREYLLSLDRSTPIAFHCHHGVRSQAAAEQLLAEDFKTVYNLQGGIDAWSQLVDPSVPRY